MLSEKVQKLEQENIALKEQLEALETLYGTTAELPKNCEYCSNFIQHYIRSGNVYSPTYDGHCVAGNRFKNRKTQDTCKAFVERGYGKNFI